MEPVIIGSSENTRKVKELVEHIADTGLNTVITGETGVGKELVAKAIHFNSHRKNKPFVGINQFNYYPILDFLTPIVQLFTVFQRIVSKKGYP